MSVMRTVGIVLIAVGIAMLAWGGIFWTQDKKVLDIGSVEVTRQEHHAVILPPIVGIVALVGGIALVALPDRGRI
jgi:uncharacterized membrane protein YidH (DUF202 family)